MKKIFLFLMGFIMTLASCNQKEKLPANILSGVELVNSNADKILDFKHKIDLMSDSTIKSMSEVEYSKTMIEEKSLADSYKAAQLKLEDLLKYNAKFSDYEEVKNIKKLTYDEIESFQRRYFKLQPKINIDFNK